mgnify:CR=1 FL=1
MIRSVYKLVVLQSEQDYSALTGFLTSLGLTPGEAWDGRGSRGAKFQAPDAGIVSVAAWALLALALLVGVMAVLALRRR